jgi:hypothetical protein
MDVARPSLVRDPHGRPRRQPHIIEQIEPSEWPCQAGPAGIYNRSSYEREARAALALWANHVRTLVEGGERKVLTMHRQVL